MFYVTNIIINITIFKNWYQVWDYKATCGSWMDKDNCLCKINSNNICKVMQLIFIKDVNMMDWKEVSKVDEGSTCHKPHQNRC
jgi:hypothetical protein